MCDNNLHHFYAAPIGRWILSFRKTSCSVQGLVMQRTNRAEMRCVQRCNAAARDVTVTSSSCAADAHY
jgi:hypothetical protein